jgi:diguanylate cyclase (GGDEF)-like protein
MASVLLVGEDPKRCAAWLDALVRAGHGPVVACGGLQALRRLFLGTSLPDAVVYEHPLQGLPGAEWLRLLLRATGGGSVLVALVPPGVSLPELGALEARVEVLPAPAIPQAQPPAALLARLRGLRRRRAWRPRAARRGSSARCIEGLLQELVEIVALVRVDRLTGLPNRRRFEEDYLARRAEARRRGLLVGVALVDIDKFKRFNDLAGVGYAGGDRAIVFVAEALLGASRLGESVYRYGGDEFAVLLSGTTRAGLARAARRLHAAVRVAATALPSSDPRHALTVSMGLELVGSARPADLRLVLGAAARRVGRVKAVGGGDVSLASRGSPAGRRRASTAKRA